MPSGSGATETYEIRHNPDPLAGSKFSTGTGSVLDAIQHVC